MWLNGHSNGVKLGMDLEEDQTGLNSLSAFSDDSERFDDVLKGGFLELELERKILLKIWTYYVTGENHSHHGGLTFEKVETVRASKLSSSENTEGMEDNQAWVWREEYPLSSYNWWIFLFKIKQTSKCLTNDRVLTWKYLFCLLMLVTI